MALVRRVSLAIVYMLTEQMENGEFMFANLWFNSLIVFQQS